MIGIDGATLAPPHGHRELPHAALAEAISDFESEFFVEWQVADRDLLAPAAEK